MKKHEKIIFYIIVGFNFYLLLNFLLTYIINNDFGVWVRNNEIINFFNNNYEWIMPALTLLASLGIFLYNEHNNRKDKEKEFYPIIVFNKRVNNNGHNWEIINYSRYPALECELNINYNLSEIDNFNTYYSSILNYELEKSINKDTNNYKYNFFINLKKADHLKILKTNKGIVKVIIKLDYKDLKGNKHRKETIIILKLSEFFMYDPIKGEHIFYNIKEFLDNKDLRKNKYDAIYEVTKIIEIS